jgi:hypothetical protein
MIVSKSQYKTLQAEWDRITASCIPIADELIAGRDNIKFTGWKCWSMERSDYDYQGGVAQWIDYRGYVRGDSEFRARFVNLPGMESGKVKACECFHIGDERMEPDMPLERFHELVRAGYAKLMESA